MSQLTRFPLYPATDGRQTGDNFVTDTRYMQTATSGYKWIQLVSGNVCPGVNAALGLHHHHHHHHNDLVKTDKTQ